MRLYSHAMDVEFEHIFLDNNTLLGDYIMGRKRVLTNADYFKVYHAENPHIYQAFKSYAFQLIASGATQLSAYLIFERMLFE